MLTPPRRVFGVIFSAALALSACGGEGDRPSSAAWAAVWQREQASMPDADAIVTGGESVCGPLVGDLRVSVPDLRPTPSEALDDAVDAWIAHAESIAFDCPDDRSELDDRFETLAVLAAEVDAGLAADTD